MVADRLFVVVDAPTGRPPRGATLLGSANTVVEGQERWVAGLTYVPDACGDGNIVQAAGYCGDNVFAGFPDGTDWPLGDDVQFVPPYVAAAQECSTIGGPDELAEVERRATSLLDRCQTVGIAREFWRGDVAQAESLPNNYLANASSYDDLGSGSDFSMLDGLAALEEGLAGCSCGGVGMIHTTSQVVTYWNHLRLLDRDPGGMIRTILGTVVVADPGYDGSDDQGGTDAGGGSSWAYATGMVDVRLGGTSLLADRSNIRDVNEFTAYVYRPFAATFDPCCHLAAQLDHTRLT